MTRILVTGAAGSVAGLLRPGIGDLDVRVLDTRPVPDWDTAEQLTGDISDPRTAAAAVAGVDAVVHLAGNPAPYASWADLSVPNTDGVAVLLDAAAAAGVPKVVLASSGHAMGGYVPGHELIVPDWPVSPCCRYGATKVFAEAYGRMIATRTETAVVCLRLGGCLPAPLSTGNLPNWLGPQDLRHLVRCALDADVRFGTYFGVSANTGGIFDLTNARAELGYEPQQDSAVYAAGLPEGDGGLCLLPQRRVSSAR